MAQPRGSGSGSRVRTVKARPGLGALPPPGWRPCFPLSGSPRGCLPILTTWPLTSPKGRACCGAFRDPMPFCTVGKARSSLGGWATACPLPTSPRCLNASGVQHGAEPAVLGFRSALLRTALLLPQGCAVLKTCRWAFCMDALGQPLPGPWPGAGAGGPCRAQPQVTAGWGWGPASVSRPRGGGP